MQSLNKLGRIMNNQIALNKHTPRDLYPSRVLQIKRCPRLSKHTQVAVCSIVMSKLRYQLDTRKAHGLADTGGAIVQF
jgi:hypothetical protein